MSRDRQAIDRISPGVVDVLEAAASGSSVNISCSLNDLAEMEPSELSAYLRHLCGAERLSPDETRDRRLALLGLVFLHSIIIAERSRSPEAKR